ncbi:MAG: MmgE/PrpD family protein [Burkholderiales bacterium]
MNDLSASADAQLGALTVTHRLAQYIVDTPYTAIPEASRIAARRFMLDTLAVAWAGSDAPGCPEAHALLMDEGGRADSTAWACGGARMPAMSAAFINGMTSAALDYDGIGSGAPVHVNITVLPAALAMAERLHASGRDFLSAFVIGADLTYRLAAAADVPNAGFHYVPIYGVFGAAAACARLLGLTVMETRHALGIAFMQASGTQQANIDPSLSKRMMSAFAARAGVHAALLAQRGVTGPAQAIEGKFGLFNMYQRGDASLILDQLGSRFDNMLGSIKMYPSCGANHTSIAGALELIRQYDLKADDVLSVDVTMPPYTARLVGNPYDPGGDAQVAAQFSVRYTIACLLVRRKLGLAEIEEDAARDPDINRHVGKINVHIDETQTGTRGPIVLRMRTRTHGEISTRVAHVPGSLEAPVSDAEIQQKFDECFRRGVRPLDGARIERLTQRVSGVEAISDMAAFFKDIL